jgi:hypothetical protein
MAKVPVAMAVISRKVALRGWWKQGTSGCGDGRTDLSVGRSAGQSWTSGEVGPGAAPSTNRFEQ